jgi:pilus assembly protein CpaE
MEILVACDDQALATSVRDSLARAGVECAASRVLTTDSAEAAIRASCGRLSIVVLFCSRRFCPEDLKAIKELSVAGGDRARLVAVGPITDPNLILRVIRGGAMDVLDINSRFDKELIEIIGRLKAVPVQSKPPGKLFSIVGTVGGVGASLLACNVAVALAHSGHACGLLDLHLRGGDLAKLLQTTPRHNLSSLATKAQQLDAAMFEQSLIEHESGVRLLPSPEPFGDYRQCTPQLIQKVVQLARGSCSVVLADLEDAEHAEQVRTLASSDQIIIPLRPDLISLYRTQKFLAYLTRAQVPRDRISIVANRVGQPRELAVARMAEVLEIPIVCQIPDDPTTVNTSVNVGIPLVMSMPNTKIARSILYLAERLLGAEQVKNGVAERGWLTYVRSSVRLFSSWPQHPVTITNAQAR